MAAPFGKTAESAMGLLRFRALCCHRTPGVDPDGTQPVCHSVDAVHICGFFAGIHGVRTANKCHGCSCCSTAAVGSRNHCLYCLHRLQQVPLVTDAMQYTVQCPHLLKQQRVSVSAMSFRSFQTNIAAERRQVRGGHAVT